jgi:hypothetical protein
MRIGRAIGEKSGKPTPRGCAWNVGRTGANFQCRAQTINGLLRLRFEMAAVGTGRTAAASEIARQAAKLHNKKGRREAGLFAMLSLR